MAVGDENIIEEDVVRIRPDLTGFKKDLQSKLKAATEGVTATVKVKLVADRTGLSASIKDAVAKQQALTSQPTIKVKLVADKTGLAASVKTAAASTNQPNFKVALRADRTGFTESIRAKVKEQQALNNPNLKIKLVADGGGLGTLSTAAAELAGSFGKAGNSQQKTLNDVERAEKASLTRRGRNYDALGTKIADALTPPKLINLGGAGVRPYNLLVASLAALSPLLISVGSNAVIAAGSLAALGAGAIGAGAAITGLVVGFTGVISALKLKQSAQTSEIAQTANSTKADQANAAAKERVLDATDALTDANRSLTTAKADELAADKAISTSRQQAIRDLEDLKQKMLDLNNTLAGDSLDLQAAQQKADSTARNFFSTSLEKRQANQGVADVRTRISDDRLDRKQTAQDLATSKKTGIDGSPGVVAARKAAADAKAARQQAARTVTRDARNLALAKSGKDTTDTATVTSPAANLTAQVAKLAPAAQEMYHLLAGDDPLTKGKRKGETIFDDLGRKIQQQVLPGFNKFIRAVVTVGKDGKSSLSIFADAAGRLGGIVGDIVGEFGQLTRSKWFRRDFQKIIDNSAGAFKTLGDAVLTLVKPFLTIFATSAPLLKTFAKYVDGIADNFAAFIDKADKSGKLEDFFTNSAKQLGKWADLGKNILAFLTQIITDTAPSGGSIVDKLTDFFADATTWAKDHKKDISDFFDKLAGLPYAKIATFAAQMAAMFSAAVVAKTVLKNPFWTALGLFAASNPQAATDLMAAMTNFIVQAFDQIGKYPKAAGTLLAILSAAKLGKTFGIDLKLPIIDSLKTALTSKFAILDKFIGGGATTATMTVTAGTVIVNGGVGTGTGGVPVGGTPVPGGAAAETPAEQFRKSYNVLPFNPVITKPNVQTPTGADKAARDKQADQNQGTGVVGAVKKLFGIGKKDYVPAALDSGNLNPNIASFSGVTPALRSAAIGQEAAAYKGLRDQLAQFPTVIQKNNTASADSDKILQDYIQSRKTSVGLQTQMIEKTKGETAANKFLKTANEKSAATLATVLTGLGWNKVAAKKYADQVYGIPDAKSTTISQPGMKDAKTDTSTLWTALKDVDGNWVAHLSTTGYKDTAEQLRHLLAAQQAAKDGTSFNEANRELGHFMARGGPVSGPGGPTGDKIHAMLSNGEYVLKAQAVRNIGVGRLNALNEVKSPVKYATGGVVGHTGKTNSAKKALVKSSDTNIPFPVDVSKTLIPGSEFDVSGLGGHIVGNANVAKIAEAAARALHATDKQLIALFEAGIVESGLRNLSGGDRDSVGFLQQRATWGSMAERMNVATATRKFIRTAKQRDIQGQTPGQLAQAVQRSGYPLRYDPQYANAVAVLNEFPPNVGISSGASGPLFGPWPSSPAVDHGHDSGVWKKIIALVGPTGLDRHSYGTLYQNRRTDNGGWSWHADGRAVDFGGFNQDALAQFFEARKPAVLELIHRSNTHDYGIRRGQDHDMGHEYGLHRNHVHVAMAQGGPVSKYDTGGVLPPGFTMAYNGTGQNETIRTAKQERDLNTRSTSQVRLHPADIQAIARAMSTTISMDGRKVAESVNRHQYLPAGV